MENIIKLELQDVKAIKTGDEWKLEALGVPFGGHINGKDLHREFFSPKTDFMIKIGDSRPVLYYHGMTSWGGEQPLPQVIGRATLSRIDNKGLWFDIILDQTKTLAKRIWDNAIKGIVKASSGAVNYLKRKNELTGEILTWAIGELTLVDQGQGRIAVNQLASVSLKTVYEEAELDLPKNFVQEALTLKTELEQEEEEVEEDEVNEPVEKKVEDKLTKDDIVLMTEAVLSILDSLEEK